MGWRGVGVVSGWQFTASLCFYAIFAATAAVRESFGVSRTLVGVALTALVAGYTVLLFLAGAAVDGYGERPVMVAGLVGLGVGMVGVAFATSFPLLLVALLVVGATYSTAMPATNRAALVVAPAGSRNLAMNVKQVGVTAGSGTGAVLVTVAIDARFGWRAAFVVAAAVAVAVAAVFARSYPRREATGSLSTPNVRRLVGVAGYRPLVVAGFFLGAAVYTTTGYVVLHLTESVGTTAVLAGLVLAGVQVSGSAGRLLAGTLADRLPGPDERSTARVLLAQTLLAALCFLAVIAAGDPLVAAVAFVTLGLFILGFPGIYHAHTTTLVPDERVGAATAGGQTALNLGGLLGPPAFGLLADTVSYDAGWALLSACTVLAAVSLVRVVR